MNLNQPKVIELFNKQIRFNIPVFQRHYVWNETEHLQPLWEDIINKCEERQQYSKTQIHPHFTGSFVLFQEPNDTSSLATYSVIDGQQRMTTFQLILISFREVCRLKVSDEHKQTLIDDFDKLIFNDKSFGDKNYEKQKYKLQTTKFHSKEFEYLANHTYEEVYNNKILPVLDEYGFGPKTYIEEAKRRSRMLANYLFFREKIINFIETFSESHIEDNILTLLNAIKHDFQFVEINLSHNDDPQMIFETMNGRGASLTETDLIRNYIFMRASSKGLNDSIAIDNIYEKYWDEFDDPEEQFKWHELATRGRSTGVKLQFFMVDYLTLSLKRDIRYEQVFYQYKYLVNYQNTFSNIEEELKSISKYSKIFKTLTNPIGDSYLEQLSLRLSTMDSSTVYPLLMLIEGDSNITKDEKIKYYRLLDSYFTRRLLCGLSSKAYNKVVLDLIKFIDRNKKYSDFEFFLLEKSSDTNIFPSDDLLKYSILNNKIYERSKSKFLSNLFLAIEMSNRSRKQETIYISAESLTIEHVMPQGWHEHWEINNNFVKKQDLEIANHAKLAEDNTNGFYHLIDQRNKLIQTLGNLTVLTSSLNPSVSNSSFEVKKKAIIEQSTLMVNRYFYDYDKWDEQSIKQRSESLYTIIKQIWCYPASLETVK